MATATSEPRSKRQTRPESAGRKSTSRRVAGVSPRAARCRRKFLTFFPKGFADQKYFAWERDYKLEAHQRWAGVLARSKFSSLIAGEAYEAIATAAVRVESRN